MSGLEAERLARVALSRATEPGDTTIAALVAELGAPAVVAALREERDLLGVLADLASRLARVEPERELEQAQRLGVRFVVPGDREWPAQLGDLAWGEPLQGRGGPPLGLWVRGPARLDSLSGAVAVVGSRSATAYGGEMAREVGAVVARQGSCVVSGAAFGIDQAAHRGALAVSGPTVAVLACGPDRAYPAAHRSLLDAVAAEGAIVSELAPGCAPTRLRFLSRNRVIAALTRGTVVVEAAVRSGALNTANWANRLNRTVLGVPGPVSSAPSQGVHQLIRSGQAILVSSGEEVLEDLGLVGDHLLSTPRAPERPRDRLTLRHQQILDAVPVSTPVAADAIARTAGIRLTEARSTLGGLERRGLVQCEEGRWRLAGQAHE